MLNNPISYQAIAAVMPDHPIRLVVRTHLMGFDCTAEIVGDDISELNIHMHDGRVYDVDPGELSAEEYKRIVEAE